MHTNVQTNNWTHRHEVRNSALNFSSLKIHSTVVRTPDLKKVAEIILEDRDLSDTTIS